MVETVESVVMWVEVPMAGLCGSGASGSQEEAGAVVGSAVRLIVDVVKAASEQW